VGRKRQGEENERKERDRVLREGLGSSGVRERER
jgi:hypothetical protein